MSDDYEVTSPTIETSDCEEEENGDGDDQGQVDGEEEECPSEAEPDEPEEEDPGEEEPEEEEPEEEPEQEEPAEEDPEEVASEGEAEEPEEEEPEEEEPEEEPEEQLPIEEDETEQPSPYVNPPAQGAVVGPANPSANPTAGLGIMQSPAIFGNPNLPPPPLPIQQGIKPPLNIGPADIGDIITPPKTVNMKDPPDPPINPNSMTGPEDVDDDDEDEEEEEGKRHTGRPLGGGGGPGIRQPRDEGPEEGEEDSPL